jgi:hypothetical protein
VIGRVVSPKREPVADALWTMRAYFQGKDDEVIVGAKTATDGLFMFCGTQRGPSTISLPRGANTMISFRKPGMEPGYISRVLAEPLNVFLVQMDPERKRK